MSRHRVNLRSQRKDLAPIREDEQSDDEMPEKPATSQEADEAGSLPDHLELLEFLDTLEVPQELAMPEADEVPDSPILEVEVQKKPFPAMININVGPKSKYISKQSQAVVENRRRIFRQLGMKIPEVPPAHPIRSYPFVMQLYLATCSSSLTFLNWTDGGYELEVNYRGLQKHLTGNRSIFRSLSLTEFIGQLMDNGFERIWFQEEITYGYVRLYYQHPNFVRGQLEELQLLVEECQQLEQKQKEQEQEREEAAEEEKEQPLPPLHQAPKSHLLRMSRRGDICPKVHTSRSPLQAARCRFQTMLFYHVDLRAMKDLTSSVKQLAIPQIPPKKARSNLVTTNPLPEVVLAKGSSTKFVKPNESVINIEIGQAPDYAGYYGSVDLMKVNEFFSEYLPRYGSKITGYKDIVMDATNKSNGFQQNLPIGMEYSDEEEDALAPLSASLEMETDFLPSTSAAAAKLKSSSGRRVEEEMDLEQVMQELCEQEQEHPETSSSSSRNPLKTKPKPRAKANSKKRLAKFLESSSSENEDEEMDQEQSNKDREEPRTPLPRVKTNIKMQTMDEDHMSYIVEIEVDSRSQSPQDCEESPEQKMKELHGDEETNDDEEEEEDFEDDDDDYNDKNVQYRTDPQPAKRCRYDLRNSKRTHP